LYLSIFAAFAQDFGTNFVLPVAESKFQEICKTKLILFCKFLEFSKTIWVFQAYEVFVQFVWKKLTGAGCTIRYSVFSAKVADSIPVPEPRLVD